MSQKQKKVCKPEKKNYLCGINHSRKKNMEKLLHYTWQHKLFPICGLHTESGETVEVIDTGLHNMHAGPDFFNAKVKVGGVIWVGNVEIHERASDWFRHGHEKDPAYNNVILHVCTIPDGTVQTADGRQLPQIVISAPAEVLANYRELLAEEAYPPCYRVIPALSELTVHSWMSALTVERLESKIQRIEHLLKRTGGDWERVTFITLARNFGFGVNTEAFEQWALALPLQAAAKHRDDAFQIETLFMGQAGLLNEGFIPPEKQDEYYLRLKQEYDYLSHKFSLTPMDGKTWRFLRLRPQNFPYIRLAQLVHLYHTRGADFSRLIEANTAKELHQLLSSRVTPYWETHYTFGSPTTSHPKTLQKSSINLIIINTVAPLLFAYGRHRNDERLCERAFHFLEETPTEQNFITRSWSKAGITSAHAADSQALIQLRTNYCDKKDCLRCRFGCEYLRKGKQS